MKHAARHRVVAVAVLYQRPHGFLLCINAPWKGYSFPMKSLAPGEPVVEAASAAWEQAHLPAHGMRSLRVLRWHGWSPTAGQYTRYDYHVLEIEAGLLGSRADPNQRFLGYPQLLRAPDVTESAKRIAEQLVEHEDVAVCVISRRTVRRKEFLLVYNNNYQYFFPCTRLKTGATPEAAVADAVRCDTGYEGPVQAVWTGEAFDVHPSNRFGPRWRSYHFHICRLSLPDVEVSRLRNRLATDLHALQREKLHAGRRLGLRGYWDWFSEDELRSQPDVSPTVPTVLMSALKAAGTD